MALKAIYSARDGMEAQLLCALLDEEGIAATVMGEALAGAAGGIPLGIESSPRVCVHAEDMERAKEVVGRFERREDKRLAEPVGAWKCPGCGEMVEGQFTDCWNCMRPRPVEGEVEQMDTGPANPALETDLLCERCGYNLRGLTVKHRCPECGLPVLRTLLDRLRRDLLPEAAELQRVFRRPVEAVEKETGFAANAVILVCHAWLGAGYSLEMPADDRALDVSAVRVCLAVRDAAIEWFGGVDAAKTGLRSWGIVSSDAIGWIVSGLAKEGLVEERRCGAFGEYRGVFDLEGLFEGRE